MRTFIKNIYNNIYNICIINVYDNANIIYNIYIITYKTL